MFHPVQFKMQMGNKTFSSSTVPNVPLYSLHLFPNCPVDIYFTPHTALLVVKPYIYFFSPVTLHQQHKQDKFMTAKLSEVHGKHSVSSSFSTVCTDHRVTICFSLFYFPLKELSECDNYILPSNSITHVVIESHIN